MTMAVDYYKIEYYKNKNTDRLLQEHWLTITRMQIDYYKNARQQQRWLMNITRTRATNVDSQIK